jgi:hypothetical protein
MDTLKDVAGVAAIFTIMSLPFVAAAVGFIAAVVC